MNLIKRVIILFISYFIFTLLTVLTYELNATDYYSRSDGTWSTTSLNGPACGCTPSGGTTNDNFTVSHTITVSLTSITIKGDVIVNSGGTLTFTGDVTFHNNSDVTINDGGVFHVNGDFVNNNNSTDVVINGTLNVDGDFTNNQNGEIIISETGDVNIGGTCDNPGTVGENGTEITGCVGTDNPLTESGPLPVKLLKFEGSFQSGFSLLKWETASEINNDYFEIQRSLDGTDFQKIGVIEGSGNSNEKKYYEFIDNNLSNGNYYYRLKQIDFDKKYSYSHVVSISTQFKGNLEIKVYPIPSRIGDNINLNISYNTDATLIVYDTRGSVIYSQIYKSTGLINKHIELETSGLTKGIYIIKLYSNLNYKIKRINLY